MNFKEFLFVMTVLAVVHNLIWCFGAWIHWNAFPKDLVHFTIMGIVFDLSVMMLWVIFLFKGIARKGA